MNFAEVALKDLQILPLLVNLVLVLVMGQIISWHYLRFAQVLSNKAKLARLFVFISATTMLVISVVKTSLALSLGLVGALSIIRFRTPIKEPEELAYLFLSVAAGIGLGADQRAATTIVLVVLLAFLALRSRRDGRRVKARILAHVTADLSHGGDGQRSPEDALKNLVSEAEESATLVDLRRVDSHGDTFNATLMLDLKSTEEIGRLIGRLRMALPGASISVVEGGGLD